MARPLGLDDLVDHFTLDPDELKLLRNKTGATRLGFSLLLKHLAVTAIPGQTLDEP